MGFRSKIWVTVGVIVALSGSLLAYQQFGHKLTIGNLIGLRVSRIALVDVKKQKAYDENGKTISLKDPFVSEFANQYRQEYSDPRVLKVTIPLASNVRIAWDGLRTFSASSFEGSFEFAYPLLDSEAAIPYQIEASAEGWHQIDSFDPRHLPKSVSLTQIESSVSASYEGEVKLDAKQPPSEYRLVIEPGTEDSSYGYTTPESSRLFVSDSKKMSLAKVKRLSLQRRDYGIVSKGFIAFGKNAATTKRLEHKPGLNLVSISAPYRGTDTTKQWSMAGMKLEYREQQKTHCMPGNNDLVHRYLTFRLGTWDLKDPQIVILSPSKISPYTTESCQSISESGREFNVDVFAPKDLRKSDIKFGAASGPYPNEFGGLISDKPLGHEPAGTGYYSNPITLKNGTKIEDFMIKIPEKYKNQDYRVLYEDRSGTIRDPAGWLKDTYNNSIGFQVQSKVSKRGEVKRIIVKVRPYQVFTFPNVHLYPSY